MTTTTSTTRTRTLTDWCCLKISGADRHSFLQGQLTQDIRTVTPDSPQFTGWSNPKGRLLCTGWLMNWRDAYWWLLPQTLAGDMARRLQMYVLRADVHVEKAAIQLLLKSHITHEKNPASTCFFDDNSYSFVVMPGQQLRLELHARPTGAATAGHTEWRAVCIASGLPVIWPETSGHFVPQMVNLDLVGGISFTKGCYVGQEIAARTRNLGRIKRRMFRFSTAGPATPGDNVVTSSTAAGEVVDAVTTDGTTQLLAVVRLELMNEPLSINTPDGPRLIRQTLPYAIPEAGHDS